MTFAPYQRSGAEPVGPGRLVLVVGPSGAGKDTLMRLAAPLCEIGTVFPRRVVTRDSSEAEPNEALSGVEFEKERVEGAFAFHWDAHGLSYGIRCSIDDDLRRGQTVVVNVSRGIVRQLRSRYQAVVVVQVTAPADILAERLVERGRKSDGPMQDRLSRSVAEDDFTPDAVIINVGNANERAGELARIIKG